VTCPGKADPFRMLEFGDLALGVWQHVVLTADGTWLRLFLDGAEVGSALTFGAVDSDPAVPVVIGAQPPGTAISMG